MKKLILKCGLALGDIVMLTAAVRDLHYWYPGQYVTDVRTSCPEVWDNNPFITAIRDDDPEAETIQCSYPLIDHSNVRPYHCLHGFIEFFNERFGLNIKPTAFKGDIHISRQERLWYSQVRELTGKDIPYWIISAGGKFDLTIKWWQSIRFQKVVDHFLGRIQFVQVGQWGHHHPRLSGVIDFRGKTNTRELIRLVHHAQGVLCPVTGLMHLAAAVPTKPTHPPNRACVVVAGGREPTQWEAYPHHQYIHTIGSLGCCQHGGCWKDRVRRLRDGDSRDRAENLCRDVFGELPRCMDLIQPEEVIRRIEGYFQGGIVEYLPARLKQAAARAVSCTSQNHFDRQTLKLGNAGMAVDQFVKTIPKVAESHAGRGIVICGGGEKYFTNAWVCINMLRHHGCELPIQLWHNGRKEMDDEMRSLVRPFDVDCVDAKKVQRKHPVRLLAGWGLKPYAILHSTFREVLLLDADNVPVANPEYLFGSSQFEKTGAIFWPDFQRAIEKKAHAVWRSCGLRRPNESEFESGQILVDKTRCWSALRLALWFNENSDFYYQHLHGDKDTFHLAFRKFKKAYSLIKTPIHALRGTMCQHDFDGRRIFQHRNLAKWDIHTNECIADFWFESECLAFLAELKRKWASRQDSLGSREKRLAIGNPRYKN